MPYIVNKTDGSVIAIVQDASVDRSTDIAFVGKNFAGYGEIQNENFIKILENFSNQTPPSNPVAGQLWFNSLFDQKRLNIWDGTYWKSVANLEISTDIPTLFKSPKIGDLWFNDETNQLYTFNGNSYTLIGPSIGADTRAGWKGDFELTTGSIERYNIKSIIGIDAEEDVVSTISAETFEVFRNPNRVPRYSGNYTKLYRGINLDGADSVSGISAVKIGDDINGTILWGTSAHSLVSERSNTTEASILNVTPQDSLFAHGVGFSYHLNPSSPTYVSPSFTYTPSSGTVTAPIFDGVATKARFADLAERYSSDEIYEPGTVVIIGGEKEITISLLRADTAIAGVISANPAYMMNSNAGNNKTHPCVALKGRVPCFVTGKIRKGDLLVSSNVPGHAEAWKSGDDPNSVFARALENFDGDFGVIEVKI